jgi:superfamily I DNA/RNA helicase
MNTATANLLIDEKAFFQLVDEVLIKIGRGVLSESHRSVVKVLPNDRVLQILAGPGSGKTEAIVWRVLFELIVNATPASRLLVTTFTRRAATELQIRLAERSDEFVVHARNQGYAVGDPQIHNLRVGTIHSLCDSLLAEFDDQHVEAGTEVIDEAEASLRLAKVHPYELGYSRTTPRVINRLLAIDALTALFCPPWGDNPQWPSRQMERVSFLGDCMAQHVETWIPRCADSTDLNGIEVVHKTTGLTADLIKLQNRWETYLNAQNLLDFVTLQKRFLERLDIV